MPVTFLTSVTMHGRLSVLMAILVGVLALGVPSALASLSDEVSAGQGIAVQVDAGTATCQTLTATELEHLGEYLMERMVGSRAAHEAMNSRMEAVMGSGNADRMHRALGRRYAGCSATNATGFGMMGSGMMSAGSSGAGGWGAMMSSDLTWMRNGAWQHMSHSDWQRAGVTLMGAGGMMGTGTGWSTGAVVAVILAALLVGALAVYAVLRRPWRHDGSRPSTA